MRLLIYKVGKSIWDSPPLAKSGDDLPKKACEPLLGQSRKDFIARGGRIPAPLQSLKN